MKKGGILASLERFELPTLGLEIPCSILLSYSEIVVPVAGIEPARPFEREILSLLCLPISPYGQNVNGASQGTRTPNQRIMSPLL